MGEARGERSRRDDDVGEGLVSRPVRLSLCCMSWGDLIDEGENVDIIERCDLLELNTSGCKRKIVLFKRKLGGAPNAIQ